MNINIKIVFKNINSTCECDKEEQMFCIASRRGANCDLASKSANSFARQIKGPVANSFASLRASSVRLRSVNSFARQIKGPFANSFASLRARSARLRSANSFMTDRGSHCALASQLCVCTETPPHYLCGSVLIYPSSVILATHSGK